MAPGILSYSSRGTSPSASAGVRTPATHSHTSSVDSLSGLAVGPFDGRRLDGVRPDGPASRSSSSSGFSRASTDEHVDPGAFRNGSAGRRPSQDQSSMPIAIVGMACRLPGSVASPAEFWELCSRARTGFTPVPKERFNHDTFYHPNPGKTGTYHASGGNFLDVDLAAFDAPFFGLTEKEAISMDPQQRLLLECTFEALENAGIPKHSIVGEDVGVFIGGNFAEYESHLFRDSDTIPMHQATGCAQAMQANRLSHFFDLRGPSYTVDTACSSSLVALHQACQSLRAGESNQAIVGGCHLNMLPEFWVSFSSCRLLSDSGRSIAFDNRGTGFGRGEGCGMIVLKPLDQALRDNDSIRAVIRGSGINQDGKTPGITMPNGSAQEKLMRQVYRNAGLDPSDCGYVEAHGTGTKVGDPLEATAIHNVVEAKQMFNRRLQVDVGYHSHHMNLVAKEYRSAIQTLPAPQKTAVRFHSSLHGVEIDGTECESHYWVNNLTCPVRFAEAFETMLQPVGDHKTGVNMILELGPHSALQGPIKQILKELGSPAAKVPYASALARKKDAIESAMDLAATLITKGAMLNMDAVNSPQSDALSMAKPPTLLTDLPRYAWNRQTRYWHESRMTRMHKHREGARSDIIGVEAIYSSDLEPTWRNMVHLDDLPWLRHHKVQGLTIFPFSGFVAMALEAAAQWSKRKEMAFDRFELRGVNVAKPLALSDTADVEMTISLRPQQETSSASTEAWYEFRICSWSQASGWTENCTGRVATQCRASNDVESAEQKAAWRQGAQAIVTSLSDAVAIKEADMYDSLAELGVGYGPAFQGITECKASDVCSVGNIISPDLAQDMPNNYMTSTVLHPTFLESAIEMYWPVLGAGRESINTVYLPSSLSRMVVSADVTALTKDAGSSLRAFCKAEFPAAASQPQPTKVSVLAASSEDSQNLILEIDGLTVSPLLDGATETDSNPARELCYKIEWESVTSFEEKPLLSTADIVIIHGESNSQQLIANGLAIAIASVTGKLPEMGGLGEVATEGKLCVVLTEIDSPFLAAPTEAQFTSVQKMLTTVQGALWVVRGAYAGSTSPESNMILGLSRTVRSEAVLPFATLDLDGASQLNDSEASSAIIKVFGLVFGVDASSPSRELEFMERRGEFFTPRIVHDEVMNEQVHRETNPDVVEAQPFGQGDRMLKMDFSVTGDVSHFVDDEAGQAPLADHEVEFEVKAVGVSLRDAVLAKSHVADAEKQAPGVEASGIITRIGSAVTSFCVGDAIAALTFNSSAFATRARASASMVFTFPETLSFKDAASLPLAYCTAHYALIDQARLEAGQRVLVHAAGSGIGQAALHLAQDVGAEVFVTVGSAEEKALVVGSFGVSEDHIFYSQDLSFGPAIRRVTANDGVDVVLNLLPGAESLRESWACLSRFGHLVDVERGDGSSGARVNLGQSNRNACFMSVDVFSLAQHRPKVMERLVASVARLVRDRKVRSLATSMDYGISAVDAACKALQSGPVFGKVVAVPQANEMVMATQCKTGGALLQAQATYVLIGGTGGLGRSMARWMVTHGARNLVLLSRRGSITDKVRVLIEEASAQGANIAVRSCDVAEKASVDRLFTHQLDGLPPVRGVIHGAMVLKDVLFEKMTWSDYTTVVNSKVQGGWNVHEALMRQDAKLDFFIAISSASGAVGNRGQAAYAAANTYLNALVQHRLAQGLPATSLDLTAVSDAGYLADSGAERAADVAKNLGSDSICEAEVLALIGAALSGKTSVCNEHVVTGMRITSTVQPFWTPDAKFKTMRIAAEEQAAAEAGAAGCAAVSLNASLRAARSEADAEAVVCAGLVDKIAAVLMMEPEELDVTRSLSHYPLDSLVAIEIRNFITRELEANMQVLELLSSGSIQTLTRTVCKKSKCCVGLEWTES
ncbi:hypothetical protein BN1723_008504 [Verticillium longisporum]|uniref:Uncharacterized protein n=1 Tax=Verticillium longisporum TaxID=100787 RepID=A0A0G4KG67_VERLO|nr:hypothetical protein BN1723_008504 [Verticillium longisporum]